MLVREIFIQQSYEFSLNKNNPVIVDCGGNIGMSVLYFKYIYPNSKIIVFEPNPVAYKVLIKNIKQNNLESSVTAYNIALGNFQGTIDFFVPRSISLAGTVVDLHSKNTDTVKIKTDKLSFYLNQSIDVLKMDVQFSETDVLADLFSTKKMFLINKIILEFHYLPNNDKNDLSILLSYLDKSKFYYEIHLNKIKPGNFITYSVKAHKIAQ